MKSFTTYDDEENETVHELPTKFEVCSQCRGSGKSSAYLGAFTSSEWEQEDYEFKEDYVAGRYDRTCDRCGGERVVEYVDDELLERTNPELFKEWVDSIEEEAQYQAMCEAERRMGA